MIIKSLLLVLLQILAVTNQLTQQEPNRKKQKKSIHHPIQHAQLYGDDEKLYYYYVLIKVGSPPVQSSVIVDTGSHMTGFTCQPSCQKCGIHLYPRYNITDSSSSQYLTCQTQSKKKQEDDAKNGDDKESEIDKSQRIIQQKYCSKCKSKTNYCSYKVSYMEGSSYSGIFLKDRFLIGDKVEQDNAIDFIFGCHVKQTNLFFSQKVNGIMGLGYQTSQAYTTLPSALKQQGKINHNEFSLCLGHSGGYIQLGDYNSTLHTDQKTEPDFFPNIPGPLFSTNVYAMKVWNNTITIDKKKLVASFDSGTTIVQMPHKYYKYAQIIHILLIIKILYCLIDQTPNIRQIQKALKYYCELSESFCSGKLQNTQKICYRMPNELTYKQFYASFPPIYFTFEGDIEIPWLPSEYFYSSMGVQCVGMTSSNQSKILLGGTFMRQKNIIFDQENNRIGIKEAVCSDDFDRIFVDPKIRGLEIGDSYDHIYLDKNENQIKFPHNLNFTYIQNVIENQNIEQRNGPQFQAETINNQSSDATRLYMIYFCVCLVIILFMCCWKNVVMCCCRRCIKINKKSYDSRQVKQASNQENVDDLSGHQGTNQSQTLQINMSVDDDILNYDSMIKGTNKHIQEFVQSASEIEMQYQMKKGKYGSLKEQL